MLSFVDDLGFIASGASVKEIAKTLEKVSKVVLQWGKENAVTYDTGKTELVLFSKARPRRRNRQLRETTVLIAGEHIKFNKEATRWLGVWLDGQLKFTSHINERISKARTAEIQIKGLTRTYGLAPGLVRQIQIAAVQSIALYGAELWWKGQKNHEHKVQLLINRQARAITGMYSSTPVQPLLTEAGLVPAQVLLNNRQRMYTYRLLSLPEDHPVKNILPISFRKGDGNTQPGDPPEDTPLWAEEGKANTYGQWLA